MKVLFYVLFLSNAAHNISNIDKIQSKSNDAYEVCKAEQFAKTNNMDVAYAVCISKHSRVK